MTENINTTPQPATSDEKLLALLSHLSLFLGGIILPIIIWATQKDKSKFVRFHSLQSIFFHLSIAAIVIFVVILFLIIIMAGIGLSNLDKMDNMDSMPPLFLFLMIVFYGGLILFILAVFGYSIYLAVKSYNGELIRIPVIGNIIYKKVYEQY